jgi:hypothetical protein
MVQIDPTCFMEVVPPPPAMPRTAARSQSDAPVLKRRVRGDDQ